MSVEFTRVTHKVINKNGWSLWLPSKVIKGLENFSEPDIYTESTRQLYPLGTKLEYADGRVFRYGKFGATSTKAPIARMVVNTNACPKATGYVGTDGFEGNLYAAAPIGQEYVDLWCIVGATGVGWVASAYAENFFEDGMLAAFADTAHGALISHFAEYRICGSEAGATPICRVYLDAPLKTALVKGTTAHKDDADGTGGTGVTAYKSIFSQLVDASAEGIGFTSAMGVCLCSTFTADSFGWIQRKGRCIINPSPYFGDTADERMAQMHPPDGSIALKATHGIHTIGYLTQRTVSDYGDLEVWLQLE